MATLKSICGERDLFIDPASSIVYYRTFVDGKKHTRSTKIKAEYSTKQSDGDRKLLYFIDEKTIRKARAEAKKLHKSIISDKGQKRGRKLFEDCWSEWFQDTKGNWSERYRKDIEHTGNKYLLKAFGGMYPEDISEGAFSSWAQKIRKESGNENMRLKKHKTYLMLVLNYLHRQQKLQYVPRIPNPDRIPPQRKVFKKEELQALLDHASPDLRLQIQMGFRLGMRKGEILNLLYDRVDFKMGIIRLKPSDTKTKKARSIPVPEDILAEIENRKNGVGSPYLFPSTQNPDKPTTTNKTAWMACKKRAGVRGRFHELRHTCATQMAHSNISPSIACRILGMSLDIYDKVYCQPSEEMMIKSFKTMKWGL